MSENCGWIKVEWLCKVCKFNVRKLRVLVRLGLKIEGVLFFAIIARLGDRKVDILHFYRVFLRKCNNFVVN